MSRTQVLILSGLGLVVALVCLVAAGVVLARFTPAPVPTPTSTATPTNTPQPLTATPRPDVGDRFGARGICQKFVKRALLAPADAKFEKVPTAIQLSSESWRVESWVDAPNRVGVHIRIPFTCEVTYLGSSQWRLVDLDMQNP